MCAPAPDPAQQRRQTREGLREDGEELCKGKEKTTTEAKGGDAVTLTRGVELVGQRAIDDKATAGAGKTLPLVWDPALSTAAFARRNRRRPGAVNHRARAFQTQLRAKLISVALD